MTGCNHLVESAVISGDVPVLSPADLRESEQQVVDEPAGAAGAAASQTQQETVRRRTPTADEVAAAGAGGAPPGSGDLTDELLRSDQWTDQMVAAAGIPVTDVP